jgi:CMP/dCMP kinase
MSGKPVVIAIDGPAGAGKSTIARRIAAKLGFTYIDTGAMYRAVALWALRESIDPGDAHKVEQLASAADITLDPGGFRVRLNGEDVSDQIRTPEVSAAASRIAVIPGVRRVLVEKQRIMGSITSIVMEGRDIGTVVFPDADVKIYLDADARERVRRRRNEMHEPDEEELTQQMRERDERDSTRAEAPLTQAPDAAYLDSTGLDLDQVEQAVLKIVRSRISNGKDFS